MAIDHHKKPFDEGTIAKLEIFEDYAQAWLPTFVMANYSRLAIFDLFAGQGHDANGTAGSSIRLLHVIKGQIGISFSAASKSNFILTNLIPESTSF